MNTFSIAVSKRLREIGVEEDTGIDFYDGEVYTPIEWDSITQNSRGFSGETLPAYTLHDIFRLMPKIGDKLDWDNGGYIEGNYSLNMWKDLSQKILYAFFDGDYPACEIVLLDLLKEHE